MSRRRGPSPSYYATDAQVAYLRRLLHQAEVRRLGYREIGCLEAHRVSTAMPREEASAAIARLVALLAKPVDL